MRLVRARGLAWRLSFSGTKARGDAETPLDAGSSRWRPKQMVAQPSITRIMSTAIETILAMHIDERDLRELEQLQRLGETW